MSEQQPPAQAQSLATGVPQPQPAPPIKASVNGAASYQNSSIQPAPEVGGQDDKIDPAIEPVQASADAITNEITSASTHEAHAPPVTDDPSASRKRSAEDADLSFASMHALRSTDSLPLSANASPSKGGGVVMVASRKQNSACDACRSRKVRCNRDPGESKCFHCKAKGIDCTTLYVQWATSSSKRPSKRPRTSLAVPEVNDSPKPEMVVEAATAAQDRLMTYLFQRDADLPIDEGNVYYHATMPYSSPSTPAGAAARLLAAHVSSAPKPAATTTAELRLLDRQARDDFVHDLVESYFSVVHVRMPLLNPHVFKRRLYEKPEELGGSPPDLLLAIVLAYGARFSQNPLIAADREESAKELQKAYASAQAAVTRGEADRANQITGSKGGIDLPVLSISADLRNHGRNRLAEDLVVRAVEVVDRVKAYRITSVENIQACLLLEPLLYFPSALFNGNLALTGVPKPWNSRPVSLHTQGFWYTCAQRHLLELGINQRETVMAIKDAGVRGELMFAWWMSCMADAASALFFRRKPRITEEDYNCEPPSGDLNDKEAPHPLGSIDSYMAFYGGQHDSAAIHRKLANVFSKPKHPLEGVRIEELEEVVTMLDKWRDTHLEKVGVPLPTWPAHWDYLAAVSACCTDILYHSSWISVWEALDELGIYGTDRSSVTSPLSLGSTSASTNPPTSEAVTALWTKVQTESLAAALRITKLVDALCTHEYLRLDPKITLAPIDVALRFLIRFQRADEAAIIIKGLRQMGLTFEDCFARADEAERLIHAYVQRAKVDAIFVPGSSLREDQHSLAVAAAVVDVMGDHQSREQSNYETQQPSAPIGL